nr:C6 transcription factor [Colletotrichum truncatum]KAF6789538.1 C6 transcription factor [Colletotrichum truncatum]
MAKKLQEAEQTIEQLQMATAMARAPATASLSIAEPVSNSDYMQTSKSATEGLVMQALPTSLSPGPEIMGTSPSREGYAQALTDTAHSKDVLASDLSIDEHGKICYYGPTSADHQPLGLASPSTMSSNSVDASKKADVMAKLLHLHWTWVAPMFMWVYGPAVRDMTTGGRYYSEVLFLVLCAHASKYQDIHHAELLFSRVRLLLGDAIQKPSSIPTIQALLQLSARELAQGSISQAWLYSGMAFRMSADLGLQHNGPDIAGLKGLSPVDLEIRRRLFWSCYFWDK